uniref:Neur_chan_LBD domain-containing protein n=1 Tax=Dracunculus medinensis TaxID=318479 RepID=A0A0N4UE37_DRAME
LYRYLLTDYEKDVRPSIRHDLPINVSFIFSLTQIIDVCIVMFFSADSHYKDSIISTDVLVTFRGDISWAVAGIFKSSCPLDVRYYPFDYQNCVLKFASWAYDGTKIDILLTSEKGDATNFISSTEWHLSLIRAEKNSVVYSCCPEPYPFIDVFITLERRPMFYVFNLILPCVLINAIALLGFYMPSDSGEKVTLGITSLLSSTVFLMLVAEGMPPTSEALPLIGIYYGVTIVIVSLATAMTVFTLNIHHHGVHGNRVPPVIQAIAFQFLAKILFVPIESYRSLMHRTYSTQKGSRRKCDGGGSYISKTVLNNFDDNLRDRLNSEKHGEAEDGNAFGTELLKVMNELHTTVVRNELRLTEKDRRDAINLEWQQVQYIFHVLILPF